MRWTTFVATAVLFVFAAGPTAQLPAPPTATRPGIPPAPSQPPPSPAAPGRDTGGRPPAAASGTSVLTGSVTIFGGLPAVGARVMVGGEGPSRMATTDARGRFTITALRAGRYYVSVSKPGYVSVTYGQRRANSQGTPVPLAEGEKRDIAIQMPRGGVITGMVLDERGEPAVSAFVRLMRFVPTAGERRALQAGGDNTDDRGIYRIHSLQPGDYAVCATYRSMAPQNDAQRLQMEIDGVRRSMANAPSAGARQQMANRLAELQAQVPPQNEPMTGYGTVCFPGSSPTPSTTIPVSAGEEKGGIDIQLQLTHVARIEGILAAPPGSELRNVQMNLAGVDDGLVPMDRSFAELDGQGKFVFQSVPPGRYKIYARSMPTGMGMHVPGSAPQKPPPRLWAESEIDVAGQDITGLALELQPGGTISGQVVVQATAAPAPTDLSRTFINLFPAAPESTPLGGLSSQALVEASGRFTISDVFPGTYRINVTVSSGGASTPPLAVQSITVDGDDVLDMPLEVKGRRAIAGMVVTMTDRITELSGVVVDDKGQPATEQTLLLYPADQKYWVFQSRRIRTTRAGEDGRYSFRVVPPGDYRLATVLDPEPGAMYDKAVLSDLESTSVRISLAEGEKRIENVRVR